MARSKKIKLKKSGVKLKVLIEPSGILTDAVNDAVNEGLSLNQIQGEFKASMDYWKRIKKQL